MAELRRGTIRRSSIAFENAPNLRPSDRVVAGLCTLFMRPGRLLGRVSVSIAGGLTVVGCIRRRSRRDQGTTPVSGNSVSREVSTD